MLPFVLRLFVGGALPHALVSLFKLNRRKVESRYHPQVIGCIDRADQLRDVIVIRILRWAADVLAVALIADFLARSL